MRVNINDDFDPEKIALSGQCFRVKSMEGGLYRFTTDKHFLYIKKISGNEYDISCSENEWHDVWHAYFDLNRSYKALRRQLKNKGAYVAKAADFGKGLRVLKQDPFEMLLTFIISQRKNIPAISRAVELIASEYGSSVKTDFETLHLFPSPEDMRGISQKELEKFSLGYRAPYIEDAVRRVTIGELNLKEIESLSDEELLNALMEVKGVGKKVANCIALFAYGRTACVPVDVWIGRAIEEEFNGLSPFEAFGDKAGLVQQYIFYYIRQTSLDS